MKILHLAMLSCVLLAGCMKSPEIAPEPKASGVTPVVAPAADVVATPAAAHVAPKDDKGCCGGEGGCCADKAATKGAAKPEAGEECCGACMPEVTAKPVAAPTAPQRQ